MARGRVFLAGLPGDRLLDWLAARLREAGFDTALLVPDAPAPPLSLGPVAAGFDLWRSSGDARFEAIADLDERIPPARPVLTLCSAITVEEVAAYTVRPERIVGFSIFGPPSTDSLVEIVPGLATESSAAKQAAELFAIIGLSSETLPPGSWPVAPRILSMIVNEAAVAIAEGVASAQDIDRAMSLGANYPHGPLELADEIGLDHVLAVLEALQADLGDDRYRPASLLRRMVHVGYTGKQAGRGFHLYP